MKTIALPAPCAGCTTSFEEAVKRRRSVRSFSSRPLTIEQISFLLWAGQGITEKGNGYRAAPSAGAAYPMTLYAALPEGCFLYRPEEHLLEMVTADDIRPQLSVAAFGQDFMAQAPLTIVICCAYPKITAHYGDRGIRYADMETGHIAENIHLAAVALGLGSVPTGAFSTVSVQELLGITRPVEPVYLMPVGHAG